MLNCNPKITVSLEIWTVTQKNTHEDSFKIEFVHGNIPNVNMLNLLQHVGVHPTDLAQIPYLCHQSNFKTCTQIIMQNIIIEFENKEEEKKVAVSSKVKNLKIIIEYIKIFYFTVTITIWALKTKKL